MLDTLAHVSRPGRGVKRSLGVFVAVTALLAGTLALSIASPQPAGAIRLGRGFWLVGQDGGVFSFGAATFRGSTGNITLNQPVVDMESTPFLEGYWFVASDGGVFSYGSAAFFGSMGSIPLNQPVVGLAAHPSQRGYWEVASDGGVFSFGRAKFKGSLGSVPLSSPIVALAPHPTGDGYWMVGADGAVYSFGTAKFAGRVTPAALAGATVVDIAPSPTGGGYWIVASNGAVFAFGDAAFKGSGFGAMGGDTAVSITPTPTGAGYWIAGARGTVLNFGDAPNLGNALGIPLRAPIVGMASRPALGMKVDGFARRGAGFTGTLSADWIQAGSDSRFRMRKSPGPAFAGGRVLGVEGLTVGQLGIIGFTVDSGPCTATNPRILLYIDRNGNGAGDTIRAFGCSADGGAVKRFDPDKASGVSDSHIVTGMDLLFDGTGSSGIDNIRAGGITVPSFRTVRSATR